MKTRPGLRALCLLCAVVAAVGSGAWFYLQARGGLSLSPGEAIRAAVSVRTEKAGRTKEKAAARPRRPRTPPVPPATSPTVQTVFIIAMENENLSSFNSSNAPYTIGTLLPSGAMAKQYYNPPNTHPSEPNHVWLEAGDNEGLTSDNDPTPSNSTATTQHLATYLSKAGLSWREYAENISGTNCPLVSTSTSPIYYTRHVPFVFFRDLTNGESSNSAACIANIRPYSQLATDLANGTVARYNFITPNGIDDMHDSNIPTGDKWLSQNVPAILNSSAFQNNGVLFILWDEALSGDGPIPMLVLSPLAKKNYSNSIHYDHSSTVLTLQEIFGVGPCLRNACSATDLADLFQPGAIPTLSGISLAINPIAVTLVQSQQQQFAATVTGSGNTAVNWTITPTGVGTITSAGLYTAPSSISSQQTVQVTATSQADTTKSATASITLQAPDFSLSGSPASQTVVQGGSATYTVTVAAQGGFNGAVSLSAGTLPAGVGVSFSPNPILAPGQRSTMNVTTSASAATGTDTITVTGTSGSKAHQANVSFVINPAVVPTYSVSGAITPAPSGAGTQVTVNDGSPVPLLVQSAPGSSLVGNSSGTVSFSTASSAGDTVVLFVRFGGTTITSVADNQAGGSNTYTSVLGPTKWGVVSGTDRWAQVFVANHITGGTKLTITVSLAGSTTHDTYMAALEYSGVNPANPVNAVAVGTGTVGTNGAPATPNLTTTVANAKLVATSWDSNESYTATGNGIGYTTDSAAGIQSISGGSGWPNLTEDRTATAAGTWNATASSSPAVVDWAIQLIALTPVSAAVADANGNYTLSGLANGGYTLTPSKAGYVFTPPSQMVTVNSSSMQGVNFGAQLAAPAPGLSPTSLNFGSLQTNSSPTFFSMTVQSGIFTGDPWPVVPVGSLRLWNTLTRWADVNPSSGVFDWSVLDQYLNLAQAHGVDLLYTLGGTPTWASSNPTGTCDYNAGACYPPANMQAWDNYVQAIATHSAGRIKYWEIWNEANQPEYWSGDIPTLVTMAQHASTIIKSIDPTAQILTPSGVGGDSDAATFLDQFFAAGGGAFVDAVAFHGYVSSVPPVPEDVNHIVNAVQSVMASRGQSGKPLWDTEGSWGTSTNLPSEDDRMAFLARHYILQWSSGVQRFYWYAWNDAVTGTLWDATTGTHLSANALGEVARWITGAVLTAPCAASNTTWTCGLTYPGGQQALIVWDTSVLYPSTVPYTPAPQFVQYRSLDGSTTLVAGGTINVGTKPILLLTTGTFQAYAAAQNVTLTNMGNAPLSVTSITGTMDYAVTNTCGSSVAAAGNCTIGVTFTPTATGTRAGAVTITDNATGSPQTISLSGTGTAPLAPTTSLSAASLSFGNQLVNSAGTAQMVTLSNIGTASLSIASITASGDYAQTSNCGSAVAAGANCAISVTFTPTATGARSGAIAVTDGAAGSPQTVALTGTGVVPAPNPPTNFTAVLVGAPNPPTNFTAAVQ